MADVPLARRVDALRRPLELAAADRFAGLAKIGGLGIALRTACDGIIAVAPTDGLRAWRARLDGFEALPREGQEVEVARGLRLVASLGVARPPAPPPVVAPTVAPGADPLAASPQTIPGIGPAFAAALAEKGIATVEDLLWLLPRRYDDARDVVGLAAALPGAQDGERITFAATVVGARMVYARGRRWCEARFEDGGAKLLVRWFNIKGPMDARFPAGARVVLSGRVRVRGGRPDMANPDVLAIEKPEAGGLFAPSPSAVTPGARIIPRYPDIPGLPAGRLRTACEKAAARVSAAMDDGVPVGVATRAGLMDLPAALRALHTPAPDLPAEAVALLNAGTSPWHRRITYGELFVLGVAVAARRRQRRADRAQAFAADVGGELARALPFAPTAAQRRAFAEVGADLARGVPMNRLLQGDVGSGKTAVAFAAALQVARAGGQAALMAPTELLAEQHERTLSEWARRIGLRTAVLTASTPRGTRQSLLALLAAGQIDLVVGTHALLSEGVGFARLGLVIIDEQHRFGVAQRVRLRAKAGDEAGAPHLLVATATPIPRTLALTAYGDLDVTILDELPPGRTPPATEVLTGARGRARAVTTIKKCVAGGGRAYVVCPLIEPAPPDGERGITWRDASTVADELARALAPATVALVHGRLDAAARDAAMTAFRTGAAQVLVATTVIEVGVDVPAATLMVIEDADHFGLAQLHQLRGRVGRGGGGSHCLLLTRGQATIDGGARLAAMAATTDGFQIAERDLELRGPGELLGARQAGLPRLRFGTIAEHTELLLEARAAAEAVLTADPGLQAREHAGLRAALARRAAGPAAYGAESG
jgi:ATP-dependent DNA helicase RecG